MSPVAAAGFPAKRSGDEAVASSPVAAAAWERCLEAATARGWGRSAGASSLSGGVVQQPGGNSGSGATRSGNRWSCGGYRVWVGSEVRGEGKTLTCS